MDATTIRQSTADMIDFAGGQFVMGSDHHYPEEKPALPVQVETFALDRHTVTNAQFAAFAEDTGYVTTAQQVGQGGTEPGSLVFRMTDGPVSLVDPSQWWTFVQGACWRAPEGPGSGISDRMDHPVIHVSQKDAAAYAAWEGKRLPTEAEWEFAAALAFDMGAVQTSANIWRGDFPFRHDRRENPPFTVAAMTDTGRTELPANMIGNVWEWTSSAFDKAVTTTACCNTSDSQCAGVLVLKGGSFLCAESYCRRYRPQARIGLSRYHTANHIGFRCAADVSR